MIKHSAFILALTATVSTQAQNWIVGAPIDMQISAITVFGGGCYPGVQANLFFPVTPVTGITYFYRVLNTNGGSYTMVPGPANVRAVGDTVHVPTTQITEVYNTQLSGGLELEIRAEGTPTVGEEVHPCEYNDLWISNLLLCNETLSSLISTNCNTAVGSVGIDEASASTLRFIAPLAANGYQLQVIDTEVATSRVLDLQGRVVSSANGASPRMDMGTQPDGVYVIQAERTNGQVLTQRFVLAR
jgi:hypothetical protein